VKNGRIQKSKKEVEEKEQSNAVTTWYDPKKGRVARNRMCEFCWHGGFLAEIAKSCKKNNK
jgi:ribosomal protein S27AE